MKGIEKGSLIIARSPALYCPNRGKKVGGHEEYQKPLTVTKVFSHGVRTKERGYVHRNNILSIVNASGSDTGE